MMKTVRTIALSLASPAVVVYVIMSEVAQVTRKMVAPAKIHPVTST